MSYFAPYIDETGPHLPTYEDRLAQLLEDYRRIFGSDIVLTEDTQDYQLCSVFAKALDDLSSLMLESYNARDPDLAAGQELDLLLPLNNITRNPDEPDPSVRLRRSEAVAAPALSTRESLLAALKTVPNVTDVILWENDTDEEDDMGIPAHSIRAVIKGGYLADIARVLYARKPSGVSTDGTTPVITQDEFGNDHTVKFSRVTDLTCSVHVYVKTLTGFDPAGMPEKIKTAVSAYAAGLKIGQDLIVPRLFTPVQALDDPEHPTFIVYSIVAATTTVSSEERIIAGPAQRLQIPASVVTVHTTPIS